MMSTIPLRLDAEPVQLLERLPEMGRLMVIGRSGPTTHERIGPVESARREGDLLRLSGAAQDSEISLPALSHVVLDLSSTMKDKVFPRLDFRDSEGATVFAVVGMEGLDPFMVGLEGIPSSPEAPADPDDRPEPRELTEDDPVLPPFKALEGAGRRARIRFERPGFAQSWIGEIAALRPSSGFLNVMTGDFHLHLRGGGIAGWEIDAEGASQALDAEGRRLGLSLKAEA